MDYEDDGQEEEEQEAYAYADYSGVVVMIQTYYYRAIELYRQYYLSMIRNRDYKPLRQQIQSYIITLAQLLKRYESIKGNKEVKKTLDQIDKFSETTDTMNFNKIKMCVDKISEAHHTLGLSKIELKKQDKGRSIAEF